MLYDNVEYNSCYYTQLLYHFIVIIFLSFFFLAVVDVQRSIANAHCSALPDSSWYILPINRVECLLNVVGVKSGGV